MERAKKTVQDPRLVFSLSLRGVAPLFCSAAREISARALY